MIGDGLVYSSRGIYSIKDLGRGDSAIGNCEGKFISASLKGRASHPTREIQTRMGYNIRINPEQELLVIGFILK
jgi:hypothetical protein